MDEEARAAVKARLIEIAGARLAIGSIRETMDEAEQTVNAEQERVYLLMGRTPAVVEAGTITTSHDKADDVAFCRPRVGGAIVLGFICLCALLTVFVVQARQSGRIDPLAGVAVCIEIGLVMCIFFAFIGITGYCCRYRECVLCYL